MIQFRETASADLKEAGDPTLHYASYNWARPYIMLVPEHCLVIDDGNGTAVGYLLGVPNTSDFVAKYHESFLPYLATHGFTEPVGEGTIPDSNHHAHDDLALKMQRITWRPEEMLHREAPNLLKQYPAHLHIDILPEYQRQGWGRSMIQQTLNEFGGLGVRGIHLGKVGSNVEAGKFYAKLGFSRFAETMDKGASGEVGRAKDGGVYLVKVL